MDTADPDTLLDDETLSDQPPAEHYLAELNQAQREAATAPDGPVLVIAGAGTGKTKTLAARVSHLIERGISPEAILLLTFSRRAAAEMVKRVSRSVSPAAAHRVWGGTFHATANRLLRLHAEPLGLSANFSVIDRADAEDFIDLIRTDLKCAEGDKRFPQKSTLLAAYSVMVNSGENLSAVLKHRFPWCSEDQDAIRSIFEQYTKRKRENSVLDYDDLLLYWKVLVALPELGPSVASQFSHILVDEYQDTNAVQSDILRGMRRENPNITVVGDDAQAIYSFRAATVKNILDFPKLFSGTRIIKLEQNYRSTQAILDASNAVMSFARHRYTKNLYSSRTSPDRPAIVTCADEAEQADEICRRVLDRREHHVLLRQQAVLFRTAYHSDALEIELTRRKIPFVKYGGLKFLEVAHVKDMVALLRIAENPLDEVAWFRVLRLLQGIGPATARRIVESLWSGLSSQMSSVAERMKSASGVPSVARGEFEALRTALAECPEDMPPALAVGRLRTFYEPVLSRVYENAAARLRDLDQLEHIATGYRSRVSFLTDLALDPPSSTSDLAGPPLLDDDWLTLSTIHSAKGMEWDAVHVMNIADGLIPSDMSTGSDAEIDEERRLLYVAMTRARDTLNLYFPLRFYRRQRSTNDHHFYAQMTRFIPRSIEPLFKSELSVLTREREAAARSTAAVAPHVKDAARREIDDLLSKLLK